MGLLSKTTTLHVNHAFLYISLLSLHDYDVKYLISRFTEDVNERQRIFLSLSKLECGLQEINSREIRLHLSFSADWNKRDNVWKTRTPLIFKLTFSLPSSLLKLPNSQLFRTSSIPLHWFCQTTHLSTLNIVIVYSFVTVATVVRILKVWLKLLIIILWSPWKDVWRLFQ